MTDAVSAIWVEEAEAIPQQSFATVASWAVPTAQPNFTSSTSWGSAATSNWGIYRTIEPSIWRQQYVSYEFIGPATKEIPEWDA